MIEAIIADVERFGPPLLQGAVYTIGLCLFASVLAVAVGLIICLCKMSGIWILNKTASLYVDIIRGTPLLLQLFYIYYALPDIGIVFSPFVAGVIGLTLNFGAYLAELFRSGIQSIEGGQNDAAKALALTPADRMRFVILPQALRNIYPAISNYALVLIKDSSLVATISVLELMRTGELLASATFEAMKIYTIVGLIYLVISYIVAKAFLRGEKALSVPGMWGGQIEKGAPPKDVITAAKPKKGET